MTIRCEIDLRCPRCNAAPGQPCRSDFDGIWQYGYHHRRTARLNAVYSKARRDGIPLGEQVELPARWVR